MQREVFAVDNCLAQGVRRGSLVESLRAAITPAVPCHGASEADRAVVEEEAIELVCLVFQQLVASLQVRWQLFLALFPGGLL